MVPDPVTTGQLGNECLIQTPGGVIVNVTEAGIDVANLGILNATLERFIFTAEGVSWFLCLARVYG